VLEDVEQAALGSFAYGSSTKAHVEIRAKVLHRLGAHAKLKRTECQFAQQRLHEPPAAALEKDQHLLPVNLLCLYRPSITFFCRSAQKISAT
jgi:hypothetical protein